MSLSLVVNLRLGLLIPPVYAIYEKKLVLSYELFFKYGGEGGFEPRYVAVYTLSSVLLQPLGHLTKLSFLSCWNGR